MKEKLAKIVDDIGPVLAGFQIAVSVVGFFGIGAVAKWILENWLPFTRWVWAELFAWVRLPEISTAEKDALTTLAFFAPMAVSSLFVWLMRVRPVETASPSVDTAAIAKETRHRVYAAVVGCIFMVIVGGSVIEDTITLFTTKEPESENAQSSEALLNKDVFAAIGVVGTLVGFICLAAAVLVAAIKLSPKLLKGAERWFVSVTRFAKPITFSAAASAISATTSIIQVAISLVSVGTVGGGIIYAAGQLGPIRTVAPLLVLLFLVATVFLNPGRLLRTAGVIVAFVVASLGWDAAVWVVNAVERASDA